MTKHKEALNLFMGGSSSESSTDLFLKGNKGLTHSNNIEFRNSISKSNSIKFESDFACSVLGHTWSAEKVKILNDYAFVSYPKYTDINKVQITDTGGGLYRAFYGPSGLNVNTSIEPSDGPIPVLPDDPFITDDPHTSGGGFSCFSLPDEAYIPIDNFLVLPDLRKNEMMEKWGSEFENLFIVVEYDGWTTNLNGDIVELPLNNGKFQVFQYNPSTTWGVSNSSGWFYVEGLDYPVLNGKYLPQRHSNELTPDIFGNYTITSSRLNEAHITSHDLNFLNSLDGVRYQLLKRNNFTSCIKFGFVGYKKIHYIKYTPSVECGRVDLYKRKHGLITFYNDGYNTPNHDLKSGDILEIVASNGQDPSIVCGVRYVQVKNSNTIFLYEDPDFTKRVDDKNVKFAVYNCIGNVYDKTNNGWIYKQSIFSPDGRNGVSHSSIFEPIDYVDHKPISKDFSECRTYRDIICVDILGGVDIHFNPLINITDDQIKIDSPKLKVRPTTISSDLDTLWANYKSFIHSYQFGSDIDLVKYGNEYILAVGERGPDKWVFTEQKFIPLNQPRGKCHIFNLSESGIVLYNTLNSSSFNTEIPSISYTLATSNTFSSTYCYAPYQTTTSSSLNPVIPIIPQNFSWFATSNFNWAQNDYWFGAILMSRHAMFEDVDITSTSLPTPRLLNYSSDLIDPTTKILFYENQPDPEFTENGARFYPYTDSFGKSIALTVKDGELIIAVGSNIKTTLEPEPQRYKNDSPLSLEPQYDYSFSHPASYGQIDFGYIHLLSYFGETSTRLKIPQNYNIFSKSYWAQLYACENFAKHMTFLGDTLYFGEPRSPDVSSQGIQSVPLERSKIHSVKILDSNVSNINALSSIKTITNPFNENLNFSNSRATIDNKTRLIKNDPVNKNPYAIFSNARIYISDDFGKNFTVSDNFIVTNSYSLVNTYNQPTNKICDYVNVFQNSGDNFLSTRISPSINKTIEVYDYENTIGLDFPASLVEIGNKHYGNSNTNSVTWDTNLANCYLIVDDTLILKDPLGYAFFETKTWDCFESVIAPERAMILSSQSSFLNLESIDSNRISYTNPIIGYGTSKAKYHIDDTSTVDSWNFLSVETSEFKTDDFFSFPNNFFSRNSFSEFGSSIDISRDDYLPLFMPIVDWDYEGFDAYTFGAISDNEGLDLFVNSNPTNSNNLNLFTGPITTFNFLNISIPNVSNSLASSNLDLSLYNGNDVSFSDFTIFLKTTDNFKDLNLTLFGPLESVSGLNFALDTPFPTENNVNLFMGGSSFADGSFDILLENFPDNQSRGALLLKIGRDPIKVSGDFDLSTTGTLIAGSSYEESSFNVFMDSFQGAQDSLNLDISVSNIGDSANSLPLKIHNEPESGSASGSLVFSLDPFGSEVYFRPIGGFRNLSIKGADIIGDSNPLFLKHVGVGGGEELSSQFDLSIYNNQSSSGVNIFIEPVLAINKDINLSISQTVGIEGRNLNVFTRGFEE